MRHDDGFDAEERSRFGDAYGVLARSLSDMILHIDEAGSIIDVYRQSEEALKGLEESDIKGRRAEDFFHSDDRARLAREFRANISQKKAFATEMRLMDANGDSNPYLCCVVPVEERGELSGGLVAFKKIHGSEEGIQRLFESEEKFKKAFSSSPVAMVITTLDDGCIIDVNKTFERISGFSKEEVIGKTATKLNLYSDLRDRLIIVDELLARGSIEGREIEMRRGDGALRTVIYYAETIEIGGAKCLLSVVEDITDRKSAEEKLFMVSQEIFAIVENAPDAIARFDIDFRHIYVNNAVEVMTGIPREQFFGRTHEELGFEKEIAEKWVAQLKWCFETGQGSTYEFEYMKPEGSLVLELRNFPEFDKAGNVVSVLVMGRDITEHRRAQSIMEKMNQLFINLGPDLIENMDNIIETAREIMGVEIVLYGRLERSRLSMMWSSDAEQGFKVADDPKTSFCFEYIESGKGEIIESKGSDMPEQMKRDPVLSAHEVRSYIGYPVFVKSRLVGMMLFCHDRPRTFSAEEIEIMGSLSRALSTEEERLAREESLKDFIDIAAHELKHPTTIIKGFAEVLQMHYEELDDMKKLEILEALQQGSTRLDNVVGELLSVSRIERGRFVANKQETPIVPLIESAANEIIAKNSEKTVLIDAEEDAGSKLVDPEKITALLIILLDNAVNHAGQSEKIEITVRKAEGEILVSVMDRGPGVPDDVKELIFNRFYQVEEVKHHTVPGMGLGLYIAREIVEAHNGLIWYEHREGGGAVFSFSIP